MGRVLTEQRTISGVTKSMTYTYNYDGTPSQVGYLSGRTMNYQYNAAGQATLAVGGAGYNWALSVAYAPDGALTSMVNGEVSGGFAGVTETIGYGNRLLPNSFVSSSSSGTTLNLSYSYFANGNVEAITNNCAQSYKFAGMEWDSEDGLNHTLYRAQDIS